MRKILILIVTLALAISLVGCGSHNTLPLADDFMRGNQWGDTIIQVLEQENQEPEGQDEEMLIFRDVDVGLSISATVLHSFRNAGTLNSTLYTLYGEPHEISSYYDRFYNDFTRKFGASVEAGQMSFWESNGTGIILGTISNRIHLNINDNSAEAIQ